MGATHPPRLFSNACISAKTVSSRNCCDAASCSCDAAPCSCGAGPCSCHCKHDCWSRSTLGGDLLGLRPCLADHGITFEGSLTQFYQGVTSGGSEQRFRYGSKMNCFLGADKGKLGLWEGGRIDSHIIDWQFGQNSIADAVAFSPVNMAMMTPTTDPSFAITSLTYSHELAGGWVFQVGRTNAFDLWTGFCPGYGIGLDGFMNFATRIPVAVQPSLSLISNTVGVIKEGDRAGIAYLYTSLHSEFQNVAAAITPFTFTDVHGGEFYYNAEIIPWFHMRFDLQALRPEVKSQDTAVVLGARAKIDF